LKKLTQKIASVTAVLCVLAAIAILVQQFIVWGVWFELDDFLHHENFAVVLLTIAIVIAVIITTG